MAIITGVTGNNTLLKGTPLADEIFGNIFGTVNFVAGSDRIFGLGGDDSIYGDGITIAANGKGGNDFVQGGDGDDDIYGDAQGTLLGIAGNDTLYQNAGSGTLVGDAETIGTGVRGGNDKLYGGGFLIGDAVADLVSANGGNDLLDAGSALDGTDLFGDTQDSLTGTALGGHDTLKGSTFADALFGDGGFTLSNAAKGGNDTLAGNGGDDLLVGDATILETAGEGGNDKLDGGSGEDLIYGDGAELTDFAVGGDDRITGGAGDDELWGDGELIGDDAAGGKDRFMLLGQFRRRPGPRLPPGGWRRAGLQRPQPERGDTDHRHRDRPERQPPDHHAGRRVGDPGRLHRPVDGRRRHPVHLRRGRAVRPIPARPPGTAGRTRPAPAAASGCRRSAARMARTASTLASNTLLTRT